MIFTNDDTANDFVVNQVNDLFKGADIDLDAGGAVTELSRFIELPLNELPKKLSRFVVLPFKVVLLQIQMNKKLKEISYKKVLKLLKKRRSTM